MKKNLNIIILGLAALSLSSCKTLYGKYERPDVKTSGIVRDVASDTDTLAVKDTTTFANIPWRSVFTDPQLQSIIEKGLNNNVNLLNAALNVKIAEEQLKCAKLAFVPSRLSLLREPSLPGMVRLPPRLTRCLLQPAGW